MTCRENLVRALRRTGPERVPMSFSFTPSVAEIFERHTGVKAGEYQQYFRFDMVSVEPRLLVRPSTGIDTERWRGEPGQVRVDEWGIGYRRGSLFHFEHILYPLAGASETADIERYPFPRVDTSGDGYAAYLRDVRALHDRGFAAVSTGSAVGGTLFWPAYKLRGMEQLFIDMHENPALAEALLERVESIVGDICVAKARAGIDVILLADDFGTQRELLMSLDLWDRWFGPRLARVIARIKRENPRLIVAFHSDGAVQRLIPRFIDIGIDVLNPVQPECMDITAVKKEYGERLSFWGTIGTQTTMPFSTPREVREAVRNSIETVGKGGGLLIAPTHVLEPEVPWENVLAFVRAVEELGRYERGEG